MSQITFDHFSFKYASQETVTLKDINLTIKSGEKILIAGPSGSGKSTLGHCINGLIPFSYDGEISGTISIDNKKINDLDLHERSKMVGTILQDQDGQFIGLSVGEDVAFFHENHNTPLDKMHESVNQALVAVDMTPFINETPHNLSGGQKQRVSLAGILVSDTDTLIFDEPLANLDPASAKVALKLIDDISKASSKTVIIIEHRIEDVILSGVDRVVLMNKGEIIADMTPDELLQSDYLENNGLREPLYIEALKKMNISLSKCPTISQLSSLNVFKEDLQAWSKNQTIMSLPSHKNVLSLSGITYQYYDDSPIVLDDVTFNVKENEILAILGNNGAGKSTLLKAISGIIKPNKGTISLHDESIDQWTVMKRSKRIGYVMQNPNHMITKISIFDEVAFGLRNRKVDEATIKEKVYKTLEVCGLYPFRNWPVSALSYGQKKRVTIASILVLEPEILILDEPTAGQDFKNYTSFMTFIQDLKKIGISVVIITHDMHLALEYADRAIVLSKGKVLANERISEVMNKDDLMLEANLEGTTLSMLADIVDRTNRNTFLEKYLSYTKEVSHE